MGLLRHAICFHLLAISFAAAAPNTPQESQATDPLSRATDEFKTLTREQGMRADSATANTHHGPKLTYHGRVYENFRNDILDAIPHEIKQNNQQNAVLHRNQFGFNLGGPLVIPHVLPNNNSTFFSISYEGVRESISRASLHTIPTMLERTGNFSKTVDQAGNVIPVYDPTTTSANPNYNPNLPLSLTNLQYDRTPFPGNVIPPSRLSPLAQKQLGYYPAPNTDIGPFFQNNYFVNAPETDIADGVIANFDRSFGTKHRLTWNSTYSNGFLGSAKYFNNIADPAAPDQTYGTKRGELDYIYSASPETVNTAAIFASSSTFQAGDGGAPFPVYTFDNYLSMGAGHPNSHRARNHYQLRDGLSTRKGKHSLTFGAQYDQFQVNTYWPAYPAGYYQFSYPITSLPGIADTGYSFASFMLGLAQYGNNTIVTAPSYFRESRLAFSFRDRYEWSKDLTVTVGATAYDMSPRTEKYNRQSIIVPSIIDPASGTPGGLGFAGVNGVPDGLGPTVYTLDPTLGIAWNAFGSSATIVRASYSRYHTQLPLYNGQFGTQGFNARQALTTTNSQLQPALTLDAGFPALPFTLPSLDPSFSNGNIADYTNLTGAVPTYQSASFSVERDLPLSMVITATLGYTGARNLFVGSAAANPNAVNPSYLTYGNQLYDLAFRETLQRFPQYPGVSLGSIYPQGRYQRDAAALRLEKRASFGLSFVLNYTYSRQWDDYSAPYGEQDFFNSHNNWSLSYYNPPQYLQLTCIFELPFGSNKPLLNYSDWRKPFIDGWSISSSAYWNGGTPLYLHPEYNITGDVINSLNVNTVPGVNPAVANPTATLWFNPNAFAQPASFTIGNASPTSPLLLNPGIEDLDMSLIKRLPVGSEGAFEFSASAFNCLNHGNWNVPDTAIGPATAPNIDAGHIIGSHGGRVIQLGMKFSF